jgi:hypothetical protein
MSLLRIAALCAAWGLVQSAVVAEVAAAGPVLTPRERGALAQQFVLKWAGHVQGEYGIAPQVWARRMVPSFVAADAHNFRNALASDTFEAASAELTGTGHRLPVRTARQLPTRGVSLRAAAKPRIAARALGDAAGDLVYTPITPCRIADTRVAAGGVVPAEGTRDFLVSATSFSAQGGSSGDCGTQDISAAAVALNVTAVAPSIPGFATVYPYGTARPGTASLNYAAGAIVNNAIIAPVPNPPAGFDFTLYSYAQSHYVIDIVGYFAAPRATALSCVDEFSSPVTLPSGNLSVVEVQCPAGYSPVGGGVGGTDAQGATLSLSYASGSNAWTTAITNNAAVARTYSHSARCCRVPGR